MPRVYNSCSEPIDFCRVHFPRTEAIAFAKYGNLGDGPDERGNCFDYDADHPPYEETDYTCEVCHRMLTARDD